MSTENSVTPPVEPESPATENDPAPEQVTPERPPEASAEKLPETTQVTDTSEPVEQATPSAPTSETQETPAVVEEKATTAVPESDASQSDASQAESASAESVTVEQPRRRVQLNPTLSPDIAKPVPSIVAPPGQTKPPVADSASGSDVSEATSTDQPVTESSAPADEQSTDDKNATQSEAASSEATIPPPAEPVAIPPKNEALDADIEAQLEAAMTGDATAEPPPVTDGEQAAASTAVTEEEISQGTRLKGTVQSIHGDDMLIDFGLRYSGVLSRRQFGLRKQPMQGEPIEVIVNRIDETEGLMHVNLPSSGAKVRGNWDEVSVDQVVECVVNQTNKGGLEVSVGSLRGFMPASQVELGYVADLTAYVGQKLQAHVTEVNPKRRKLVLSRRKILEETREQTEKDFFEKLAPGQTYEGKVKTLKDYGAFVDIGGVDGLLHVGQISWSRINHPSEVLSEGQMVEVKVLSVDQDKKKIGLGMRQMTQNPWRTAEEKYPPESTAHGKVTRIEGFGAFIELEPGIEGLVHISELDYKRVKTVHEVLRVGQEVDVQVLEVNPSKKRISLSLKALKEKPEEPDTADDQASVVQHVDPESLKGGIGEPTGGQLFGDPNKFGG